MLYLSTILIQEKDVESFDELLDVVKMYAKSGERFIRLDLKPPYPDTPKNWEEKVESAFTGYIE
ncbi:MAG: sulfur relay protein DsrC [Gammaproteobacteria bacterium]|nr:sulfur relay protein DsrC [Gammaproteobacteria bacterium]|tara:strand:+ start:5109 stop:5300 length:192 start_codon:yes stop_codon:yes gene_type:complete